MRLIKSSHIRDFSIVSSIDVICYSIQIKKTIQCMKNIEMVRKCPVLI